MTRDALTYEVLTQPPQVKAILGDWDRLLERSLCNRAFSSPHWYLAACATAPVRSMHVIVARRGGVVKGVFPLALAEASRTALFPGLLGDYNDLIAGDDDRPVLAGLLDFAITRPNGYDKLVLRRLRRDSNCLRAARAIYPARLVEQVFYLDMTCPYIDLPPTYEDYLATRSRNFRKGLKAARRKAIEAGVEARELEPESFPPARLPEVFLRLHLNRFGLTSSLATPAHHEFTRRVLPDLFVQRRVRGFALFRAGDIIAIDVCMVGDGSLCAWNGGFLAEVGRWSPGRLLIDAEVRHACGRKLEEYDFLRGREGYKLGWATASRDLGGMELDATG